MSRRLKAALMLAVWVLGLIGNSILEVSAAGVPEVQSIKNNIVELLVNKEDGRFAVKTAQGSPSRQEDNNKPLLFSEGVPETTFTTFRIDGKDYIYGNSYNGIVMDGGMVTAPKVEGMNNISGWRIGDIAVTQKLELTDNMKSSDVGNIKISYSITNNGTKSSMVGTRLLLDMMLGSNDGCSVSLDGNTDISYETQVMGEDIPVYWRCTDSADSPRVVAYGFIKGWGNTQPDRMTIAHWNALSASKWDYSINPKRNIGSSLNEYKSADSAAALYWEPKALEPGETIQFETYYGLGSISDSTNGDTFSVNVLAPARLNIKGDIYENNPFDILMELDNSLESSEELVGINAELILPDGLELAEGQQSSQYLYRIPVSQKQTASWKVKALNTQRMKVLQYMIRITSLDREIKNIKKFIIIPGFEDDDSDIGYTDIVPRNLYYEDEDNAIQIIGYGFEKLKDKSSYEMSLVNTSKGNAIYLGESDISIISDNQVRIRIAKGLDTGTYKLVINHKNDMLDYTLGQYITVTSDVRYKSRNYGILVIKEENIGGKRVQSAVLYENESQLSAGDKSNAMLIIRGKVRSVSDGRFDVSGDTIAINNDIYYKGYGDNNLTVSKSGGSFIVKGNGELYMQSALLGKSMDITLKKGHFYIDSAEAVIEDEDGYVDDTSVLYVGYFPILVKKIKIQSDGEVKVDGILQLENKYFNFLTSIGTGFMESDIKDMGITNKKIDIDTEITIPFPRWKLGGFQSKDYMTKKSASITFFINTTKGAYGFKTKAENPKLKLLDINAEMAFDKNLYPDYFEFENKYGAIPKPIGSTGLAFESIGGGIYGLKSMMDSLRYGILPTGSSIAVRADIVDLLTYHARIKGYTLVGLRDIEAVLSCSGIDLEGDGYIYFIDVGDIAGHFDFSGGYISADLNILDILIADAYFGISSHEIKGSISGKVKVPDRVWFIGGKTISSFGAGLSDREIEGNVKFMGVGVGICYKWGGSVSFDVASLGSPDKKSIYTVKTKDARGEDVTISYGTNIEKLRDIPYSYNVCYGGSIGGALALGASAYTYKAKIDESVESAIIEMKYDSSAKPEITVTDPDGSIYELVEEVNYRNHIIPADVSDSGMEEKRLFVTIVSPKPGEWTIESDKAVKMTLYNAKEPAVFQSLSAKQEEGRIKVDWELNKTEESEVALYLVREDGISSSIEIGENLDGASGSYECPIPSGITTGSYKVRGEVKRNGTGFDEMYSGKFEIIDALAPEIPSDFTVKTIGNGMMKAQWDEAIGADEYRIYAVDDEGKIDKTVEAMVSIDGDKTETIFGGTLFDGEGKEYGWLTGRTYKYGLYAVDKTLAAGLEEEHISKPSYSEEIYLPKPQPPEFTIDFTSEYGNINIEKDENDNEIRYTNAEYIDCRYRSDETAKAVFYINGEKIDEAENKNYSLQLNLVRGSNMIEIEAVGENGDKAIKAYDFYYDDRAPELMVQSPNSNDAIQSGSILVSGKTTAGSKLYVNGARMTVEEDGSFNEEYMLSDLQRETITITSMDLAGNRTEYSAEVLNSGISDIVKVKIMPEDIQMKIGERIQMRLYGMTEDNRQILLEPDKVDWQIYDTEGSASITKDGLLTARKYGEIAVNAEYIVSADRAYEDAAIVRILQKTSGKDDEDEDKGIPTDIPDNTGIIRNSAETGSLVRRKLDFRANEEIIIPGLLKLKFTGDELFKNGYIEVHEIKDLLEYRDQSDKDFLSNIFDIKAPEGYKSNSPVEMTIYFNKNKAKGLKHIGIYEYDEKNSAWELIGGAGDEANGSVTIRISHFSKYAVMENSGIALMTDIEGHWARDAVYRLMDKGIVNGIKSAAGEYMYEPERPVTRAEFAKMLSLSAGYVPDNGDTDLSQFADDGEILPWARTYMKYCNKREWMNGKGIGKAVYMKPNDTITRAEAAAMISRASGFAAADKNIKAAFSDKNKIPDWAAGYIDQLTEEKLMQGYSDDTFRPEQVLIRAEAAALFDNYLKK
ncbi:S-layer homology domain-containing protein [Lutispora saccharofermentans]|uniref:S-layer homology domain-containing protein n=1 Tax=Lutispora saccharofermentans TaxID=3024236 RepID=A0ABT1NGA3_9FIRM|nr:S-layer homology domain-containing protein [Lutispora saccharofermentans]MCQ1530300.1 S-layer homology domain-containing protein [Lutispora saccharofermentans]